MPSYFVPNCYSWGLQQQGSVAELITDPPLLTGYNKTYLKTNRPELTKSVQLSIGGPQSKRNPNTSQDLYGGAAHFLTRSATMNYNTSYLKPTSDMSKMSVMVPKPMTEEDLMKEFAEFGENVDKLANPGKQNVTVDSVLTKLDSVQPIITIPTEKDAFNQIKREVLSLRLKSQQRLLTEAEKTRLNEIDKLVNNYIMGNNITGSQQPTVEQTYENPAMEKSPTASGLSEDLKKLSDRMKIPIFTKPMEDVILEVLESSVDVDKPELFAKLIASSPNLRNLDNDTHHELVDAAADYISQVKSKKQYENQSLHDFFIDATNQLIDTLSQLYDRSTDPNYNFRKDAIDGLNERLEVGGPLLTWLFDSLGGYDITLEEQHDIVKKIHDKSVDVFNSYFEGNKYSHACPFALIMEEGLAKRLVQVGIRTMNLHQREQANRYGVEVIEMKDWQSSIRFQFDGPVYLSFDMDAIDPAFAPGVSHHEPGGFTSREVISILQNLKANIVGADLVEFNPTRDPSGITAMLAAKLYKEMLDLLLRNSA